MAENHIYYLIGLFIAWSVLSTVMSFYHMFHAPRCPKDASFHDCLSPMFADGEPVDFYVYLTANPKLRWWTVPGINELRKAPLWNATTVKYGQPVEPSNVVVPLSLPTLHGVRRNESMLHAHCFLTRSGSHLEETIKVAAGQLEHAPRRGVLSPDVLHTSTRLTRLLPSLRRKRRNLLSNATLQSQSQSEDGTEESSGDNSSSRNEMPPVFVMLPVVGWSMPVYPSEALAWVGSAFSATAFLEPSALAAVIRGSLAVVVAPWLLQLRTEQMEKRRAMQRQRASENALWLQEAAPIVPHLVPLVRVALAVDDQVYDARAAPPLLYKEMLFEKGSPMPARERDVRYAVIGQRHVPPLAIDKFGLQQRTWRPLDGNTSKPDPEVMLEVDISGMVRYSVVQTMKQSLEMYMRMGFTERDLEDLKDFFFRYPLHILIIMQVIGFLQMTLTTLAFKNDISFFRTRADYTGLSSRSLATDTLQEIIIFLYLYDYDDISRLVLFQVGVSAAISAWKYARVARLGLYWSYWLPWVSYNRGAGDNAEEKGTEEIDARGMRYLKFVLYPLSAVWGIYNLYHYSYKSWWSWLVSSMADFAYTFGFINMMPQIFINYKLKSVAHMPWRVLMYKFFNTFIDDVFAFFIMSDYMTKKHRFMTLRDDVVFFIFLYQRHIYRVDPNRPDEFGYVYADTKVTASAGAGAGEGAGPGLPQAEPPAGVARGGRPPAPEGEGRGGAAAGAALGGRPPALEGEGRDSAAAMPGAAGGSEAAGPARGSEGPSLPEGPGHPATPGGCERRTAFQGPVD